MTREEAIEIMQINRDGVANMSWSEDRTKTLAAFDVAIKALEQEPVLDKIRAEIAEYKDDKVIHDERNEMIDIVLDIIDKYKAESEEQA